MCSIRLFASISTAILGSCVALLTAWPILAAEPKQTTATYDDWTVRCAKVRPQAKQVCEMVQAVRVRGKKGILAQIAIGKPANGTVTKMVMQVPTRVMIQSGATITLKPKGQLQAKFLFCAPNFCLAEVILNKNLKSQMLNSKNAFLSFVMANKKAVKVPVSLKGLADAFNAIGK